MIKLVDLLIEAVEPKFEKRANEFIKRIKKAHDVRMKKEFPTLTPNKYEFAKGKRYWKVVTINGDNGGKSAHSFLDTTTGDVLKAAGWRAPAKHARGNIYNADYGMGGISDYGAKYLR